MTSLRIEEQRNGRDPAEALPRHVAPMLAALSEFPAEVAGFGDKAYGFEYKWDGLRVIAYWDGERVTLESRNRLDITGQYPELQPLAAALPGPVVLDGEVIALDSEGRVSFNALSHRMHLADAAVIEQRASEIPVTYMIFDVLYMDGHVTMDWTYERRREALDKLALAGAHWQTPPWWRGGGEELLAAAAERHLEGVVAKRLDSAYEAGQRTGAWRKIKLVDRQEFVIGGWQPYLSTRTDMVGSILVGYYEDGGLRYAGSVGTGFSDRMRLGLATLLEARESATSPFKTPVGKPLARFVRPELVAEVEYRGWSGEDHLRQPSYKGLRTDKDPREVVREQGEMMKYEARGG